MLHVLKFSCHDSKLDVCLSLDVSSNEAFTNLHSCFFYVCNTSIYIWFNVVNNFDFMLNILALPTPLRFVCVFTCFVQVHSLTHLAGPSTLKLSKLPPCRGGQVLQLRQHQDFQGGEVLVRIVSLSLPWLRIFLLRDPNPAYLLVGECSHQDMFQN